MAKIKVLNPIVEMDGDEMTRIIWQWIRQRLILPYLDVDLKYYDLSVEKARLKPNDQIIADSANASPPVWRRRRNAPPSHPMRRASRNSISSRCGKAPDGTRSAISSMAPSSASPSVSARTFRSIVPHWDSFSVVVTRHGVRRSVSRRPISALFPAQAIPETQLDSCRQAAKRSSVKSSRPPAPASCSMFNLDASIIRLRPRRASTYALDRHAIPSTFPLRTPSSRSTTGRFKNLSSRKFLRRIQTQVRCPGTHLRTPPDRRHGCIQSEVERRVSMGL